MNDVETSVLTGRYGSRAKTRIEMLREFIAAPNETGCMDFKFSPNAGGYARISVAPFTLDYAHRVVCRWTHGDPPSDKHEAAHSCGRRSCVNPTHLRWATRTENMADAIGHGTTMRGERSPVSRLTEAQVHEIRQRITSGERIALIAKSYGVRPTAIYSIRNGKSWWWLEEAS